MLEPIYDYVTTYTNIPPDNVYVGYQNRVALPTQNLYAIIHIDGTERVGSNIIENGTDDTVNSSILRSYAINIDFCGLNQSDVQEMAGTLENITRSYISTDFFKNYNISSTYADDIQYIPYVDEQEQYIHRYRLTLHYTKWETVTIAQQYADVVTISRIENIDTHHKGE